MLAADPGGAVTASGTRRLISIWRRDTHTTLGRVRPYYCRPTPIKRADQREQ